MSIWNELGIAPTRDLRSIKLAYAARLKQANPEDDAEAFQRLRQAYDLALAYARAAADVPPEAQESEPAPPAVQAPKLATLESPHPAAAAQQLMEELLPALPRERLALLERSLRQPGWEGLDFRRQLEAALVQVLLRDFDRLQPLVDLYVRHYGWRTQPSWEEDPDALSPIDLLLARQAARTWWLGIANTSRKESAPQRQALAFLSAPPDETTFRRYGKRAVNRVAMHKVLLKLRQEHPVALQFEVDRASFDWWQRYDSSLGEADLRVYDYTRLVTALFWACLGVAIWWLGNQDSPPPRPAPSPPRQIVTAPPPPAAPGPGLAGMPRPQLPLAGPGITSTVLPGAQQRGDWPPDYLANIDRTISSAVRYPPQALRDKRVGTVLLQLELRRDGGVAQSSVLRSSGVTELDAEALAAVRRVGSFPPVPAGVYPQASRFSFVLPINFRFD